MFNCGKTQIDTILENKELILSLYESNDPSRVHTSKHPILPSMLKLMKPGMIGMLFWKPQTILSFYGFTPGTSKLTHNHCEVHCNMIIVMHCHCVVDYSDIQ